MLCYSSCPNDKSLKTYTKWGSSKHVATFGRKYSPCFNFQVGILFIRCMKAANVYSVTGTLISKHLYSCPKMLYQITGIGYVKKAVIY